MPSELSLKLDNYLMQLATDKSVSQILLLMNIVMRALSKMGISYEELISDLQARAEEFRINKGLEDLLKEMYARNTTDEQNDDEVISILAWIPVLDLVIKLWNTLMLALSIDIDRKKALVYVSKDGKDYLDFELVTEANEAFAHRLYRCNNKQNINC